MLIPPGEKISETKKCRISGEEFIITDKDLEFYNKVSPIFNGKKYLVPSPTLCPAERTRRRFSHRNERHLYNRKCDLTGRQIVSNFGVHTEATIYEMPVWFSDDWTAADYAMKFDFNEPFFSQFDELHKKVPQLALCIWNSENSNYCNCVGSVKNSYLIFGSVYCEDCYYGSPYYSNNCVDSLVIRECESCFECVDCRKLNSCYFCQDCHSSDSLWHCFDCKGCSSCIGCVGLKNQNYHIFNKKVSREEFKDFLAKNDVTSSNSRKAFLAKMKDVYLGIPHKYLQGENIEGVSGNYIYNCKNAHMSYYTDRCEDTRYSQQVVDLKDCYDNNYVEENNWCLEFLGNYRNDNIIFTKFSHQCVNGAYLDACFTSQDMFGCIGMRNARNCIFNTAYSKKEYEDLCGKLIEHMRSTGEWGEYFPHEISFFGYNETVAQEYFSCQKDEILEKGWKWADTDETSSYHGEYHTPLSIDQYDERVVGKEKAKENIEDCLKGILKCEVTKKPFKIIKQELGFYIENAIPLPTKGPDQRHKERLALRNPRKLFQRVCDKCDVSIASTYSPDRPEKVYCEKCYQESIY